MLPASMHAADDSETDAWRHRTRRPAPVRLLGPRPGDSGWLRHGVPALLVLAGLVALLAGCGGEADEHDVVEGEAATLGHLEYRVELTRFLNPADTSDVEYLAGQPPLEPDESYLGVFVRIENDDDERDIRSASDYTLVDIRGNRYEPQEAEGPFALDIGGTVPAGRQLPVPDSMAAMGPARGGVLVFRVDAEINQRLPLSLEIVDEGETATIQLGI